MDESVQTNIYFKCTKVKIQLVLFYKRNNFLWTGADLSSNHSLKPRWFGDVPRAMQL